jgi:hypothetical protein
VHSILRDDTLDKLPVAKSGDAAFMERVRVHLPEKRLQAAAELAVQGILARQSPLVSQMARGLVREAEWIITSHSGLDKQRNPCYDDCEL